MLLLHWCTLEPAGPSRLAALRFSSPVRVRSLRVFPAGAQPFAHAPALVSETAPDAFVLDVFFNAHPIATDPKLKAKATNVLVPTSIAYAGGHVDFPVDMGGEFASRLMIVQGNFTKLSLAIYGDVASELPSAPSAYTPRALPALAPLPLTPALDPAAAADPTALPRALLALVPAAPPLALVVRLMFCLKPASDDWDRPAFPYLHPDLDDDAGDDPMGFDLEYAYGLVSQPVADDVPLAVLQRFADRVADAVGHRSGDRAYYVAGILSRVACQHRELPRLLTDRLDLPAIFDASTMDEDTLEHLLVAAANPDIARALAAARLSEPLETLARGAGVDAYVQRAAQRVLVRLRGWAALAAAIDMDDGLDDAAREALRDLGGDEPSFGVALHAFIAHPDLAARVGAAPALGELRRWVGVAGVLAAYAWADSVPNEMCRARVFGVMRVWQTAPGYREVLNYLLLLRQMIFRLECMTDDDTPTRASIAAEQILHALTRDPNALHSPHLARCILALQPGFSAFNATELAALRTLADTALPSALDALLAPPPAPIPPAALRTLRTAAAVLAHELDTPDGEDAVLRALWARAAHGLPLHLLAALEALAADARAHFGLAPPPPRARTPQRAALADVLAGAQELLALLARLVPAHPLPGRAARALVHALADLHGAAARAAPSAAPDLAAVARALHAAAPRALRRLLPPDLALRVLLRRLAAPPRALSDAPRAALDLLEHVLPPDSSPTNPAPLAAALPALAAAARALPPALRARLLRHAAALDARGALGAAEWLVLAELRALRAPGPRDGAELRRVRARAAQGGLRVLCALVCAVPRVRAFVRAPREAAGVLAGAVGALAGAGVARRGVARLGAALLDRAEGAEEEDEEEEVDPGLAFALALFYLDAAQHPPTPTTEADNDDDDDIPLARALHALRHVPIRAIDPERLARASGTALLALARRATTTTPPTPTPAPTLTPAEARAALGLLERLRGAAHAGLPQLGTLRGVGGDAFGALCGALGRALPGTARAGIARVRAGLEPASEDFPLAPAPAEDSDEDGDGEREGAGLWMSPGALAGLLRARDAPRTPPLAQGVLGMVTVSPPTALLRSPAVTGLTKTYAANDFRALRAAPSARQNTSRMPSTHVDEFQSAVEVSPVVGTMALPPNPYVGAGMHGLGPPFGA
ncbi:hypothetical protein BC834DRAFT_987423 [Gloeopeniophorella convolvens]|nr:hypothetical protein BC834DRAFT_987423 [Gloeopeniophorella convolvens]